MNSTALKLVLIALMGTSTAAFAQHGPPPSADEMVQRMTEQLSLTTEQQASVRALMEANSPEQSDREQGRANVEAGLKTILTETQYVEFEASRQNREGGGPDRGPEGKGRGGMR